MFTFKKCYRLAYIGIILLSLMFTMATASVAKQPDRIADIIVMPDGIELSLLQSVLSINITISGPDGLYFQKQLSPDDPYIPLYTLGEDLMDGYYKYEIKALSSQEILNAKDNYKSQLNNGRDKISIDTHARMDQTRHARLYQSGGFQILNDEGIQRTEINRQHQNKRGDADE